MQQNKCVWPKDKLWLMATDSSGISSLYIHLIQEELKVDGWKEASKYRNATSKDHIYSIDIPTKSIW